MTIQPNLIALWRSTRVVPQESLECAQLRAPIVNGLPDVRPHPGAVRLMKSIIPLDTFG